MVFTPLVQLIFKKNLTIIDVNKLIILAADVGHVHVMGRGTDILVLFVSEDVQSDHVDLGVAVLAGLGGGHFHNFAGTTLFLEKIKNINVLLLQSYFLWLQLNKYATAPNIIQLSQSGRACRSWRWTFPRFCRDDP